MRFEKLIIFYKSLALVLLNMVVIFVILNGIAYAILLQRSANPILELYEDQLFLKVYPGWKIEDIKLMLTENWTRTISYEPFTGFKERPYSGRFLNVSEHGFRLSKDQGPWPLDPQKLNIFVFGGSTTFNYGLADDETIASFLQNQLASEYKKKEVAVYNWGRAYYYSTQERVLFQELVTAGHIPDIAVFIDGLNDFFFEEPAFTSNLRLLMPINRKYIARKAIYRLPLTQLLLTPSVESHKGDLTIQKTITRYLQNKKMVESLSEVFDITPVLVWQPIPLYKYDLSQHLMLRDFVSNRDFLKDGYEAMARRIENEPLGGNFLYLANMQEPIKASLYIDQVHYSADMSKRVAQRIVHHLTTIGNFPSNLEPKLLKSDINR